MFKPAVLFAIALTSYFSAQAQWRWINPMPSGAISYQVRFTDDQNGFIFNSNTELIRTGNMGDTWQIVDSFPRMVCFDVKGRTGIMGGWDGRFYISRDGGDTWELRSSGLTGSFQHVFMVSEDVFFFYSGNDNNIFKTIDGGDSWQTLTCDERAERIFFVTPETGYVGVRDDILKTTDGGVTWISTNKSNVIPSNTTSMFFIDENTGYVFREHSKMLSTTDGGNTWKTTNITDKIHTIHFSDLNTGYAGGEYGALYRTTDAGNSWQWIGISARIAGYSINAIYFLSNTTGFAVGHRGRILKTTDGGNNWQPYTLTYDPIVSLEFPSENTGYAFTGRDIFKTINRGVSWRSVSNFDIHDYSTFGKTHFVNEHTGFVTTNEYTRLYRTTNGGESWAEIYPTYHTYQRVSDLDFLTPEMGYMVLQSGVGGSHIVKTTDGGETWQDMWKSQYMGETFSRIDYVSETTGYALRHNAVYKTTDNSRTWQKVFESNYSSLNDVYFIHPLKGFVCGDQGILYMTTDAGNTWTPIGEGWSDVYHRNIKEIRFFNEEIGYARMGDNGILAKTTDGGLTWSGDGNYGGSVITFAGDSTVYIAGGNGLIIAGSVKAPGLFSFVNTGNSKCTVSFSVKEKKDVPAVNNIWLEINDARGNTQMIHMAKDPSGENAEAYVHTATVPGLFPGQTYTARVGYNFENIVNYYGNIRFTVEGFARPSIIIDDNGTTLSSSVAAPAEWYLDQSLIPGMNTQQIQPVENGVYTTRVNEDGCVSEISTPVLYIRENMGVSIYPNPATSHITITNSRLRELDIRIFDMNGVLKLSTTTTQFSLNIQLLQFPPGVYTLWIYDRQTDKSVRLRFLKQ